MSNDLDQEMRITALQAAVAAGGGDAAVLVRAETYWNFLHHGHPLPQVGDINVVTNRILARFDVPLADLNALVLAVYAQKPGQASTWRCRATAPDGVGELYECVLDPDHAPVGVPHAHATGEGVLFVADETPR